LLLGGGRPASPQEQPRPIASLERLTAYLTLQPSSLSGAPDGFTNHRAEAQARVQAPDQSVVAVATGDQLTERQLLERCWSPPAVITQMLAAQVAPVSSRHRPDVTQSLQQEKR
jgi:hypothetical protein